MNTRRVRLLCVGLAVLTSGAVSVNRLAGPPPASALPAAQVAVTPAVAAAPAAYPNDPLYPKQWWLGKAPAGINVQAAWQRSRGAGVTIAVVDSGVVAHPDLQPQLVPGYDFVSKPYTACDGDGWDADPTDPGSASVTKWCRSDEEKSSWHGTHVAGIAAAATNNRIGIAAVAPEAKIQPVRVTGVEYLEVSLPDKSGLTDAANGIMWAAGVPVKGAPANRTPAKVINASLGWEQPCSAVMQRAITAATQRGSLVVVSAGNSDYDIGVFDPGSCNGATTVGATDAAGKRALYSQTGKTVALSAPGSDILSTSDKGKRNSQGPTYVLNSGTSMAAPVVAGVAALLWSANPTWTPAQIRQRLISTVHPFAAKPTAASGAGIVDAGKALAPMLPAVAKPDAVSLRPGAQRVVVPVLANDAGDGRVVKTVGVPASSCGTMLCLKASGGAVVVQIRSAKWRGTFVSPYTVAYTDGTRVAATLTVRVG